MRRLSSVLAAGVALLASPAVGLFAPAVASADPAVVSATVYTGAQTGITSQTVTVAGLNHCPTYTGASPFLLNPGTAPYQPVAGSSWSLDTIVECGLGIPAGVLTGVAVQSAHGRFETPLSASDLTDAGYQDPTAPGALPVVSLDGGQNQVTYARPERSPGDPNAADSVTDAGPVTIAVYENAAPLHVRISVQRLSVSSTALKEQFAATVTDAAGQAPPAAGLSWSWSFDDGVGSARPTPAHRFPLGRWFVTVVVTDHANGTGGTATLPVTVDAHALLAAADRSGAGNHRSSSSSSGAVKRTVPTTGHGATPRTPARHRSGSAPTSTGGQSTTTAPQATTPPQSGTTPAGTTAPAATAAPITTTRAASPHGRHHAGRHRPARLRRVTRARSASAGQIVRGLLIADVTPVAPAASALAQVTAPARSLAIVRAATRSLAGFSGLIAVAVIVALLALGADRERRGRRRWRDLRPGP